MAEQGKNDFFLNFGSNAAPFSSQIAEDLNPGIEKIRELERALKDYETQAGKSKKGSSPLGLTFEGLDSAAERIEQATENFSRNFQGALDSLTEKVTGLREVLNAAARNVSRAGQGNGSTPPPPPRTEPPPGPPPPAGAGRTRGFLPNGVGSRASGGAYGGVGGLTPEQEARLRAQRRNAPQVTAAEQAAADKSRKASQDAAQATQKLADVNAVSTDDIKATTSALKSLNTQLKAIIDTASKVNGSGNLPANTDAAVQIGNTTGNPVPVIVVGGEAQAAGGHPSTPHGHIPTATTATSTAKAREEVKAAAELANQPNSYRNPSRVMPGDQVSPGQYFLLPGDDAKQPRRAYGIRPGETAGQYTERVDAVRQREQGYLSRIHRLSDEDQAQLGVYSQAYGPFPEPRSTTTREDFGTVNPAAKSGSVLPISNTDARHLPKEVQALLNRRDLFAADAADQAHSFVLDELRRDPHLTQDGLSPESKSALARIDETILAVKNKSEAARLFNSKGTPELEALREGATRRRYMADTGSAAYEEYGQRRYINARSKEVDALAEEAEVSDRDQAEVNAYNKSEKAKAEQLTNKRRLSQVRRQNAEDFNTRLNRLQKKGGYFVDPEELDENGKPRRYEMDQLLRQFGVLTGNNPDFAVKTQQPARDAAYEQQVADWKERRDAQEQKVTEANDAVKELERQRRNAPPPNPNAVIGVGRYKNWYTRPLRPTKESRALEEAAAQAQAQLDEIKKARPTRPERETESEFDALRRSAQAYTNFRVEENVGISEETLAATPAPEAVEEVKRSRRGGRPKQAESQAVAAVKESTGAVEQVKQQIHDLNAKLVEQKRRLERTREGSQNNQKLTDSVAKLEQQKTELLEEKKRLNRELSNARRRQATSSKSEQAEERAEQTAAGGTRIKQGQSINLNTGEVEDSEGHPVRTRSRSVNLPGAAERHSKVDPNSPEGLVAAGIIAPEELALVREHQLSQQRMALKGKGDRSVARAEAALNQAIAQVAPENLEEFNPESHDSVVEAQRKLQQAIKYRDSQYAKAAQVGAGGNGNKPPTTPPPPAPAPEPEPEPQPAVVPPRPRKVRPGDTIASHQHQFDALDEQTQRTLLEQRAAIASSADPAERLAALRKAADALVADPAYANRSLWGTDAQRANTGRSRALAGLLGLDEEHSPTRGAATQARIAAQNARELAATRSAATGDTSAEEKDAAATERLTRMEEALAGSSGRLLESRLALIRAENELAQARARVANTPDMSDAEKVAALAPYEQRYASASRSNQAEEEKAAAEANRSMWSRVTGRPNSGSFAQDMLRHGSYALTNTIGYSLVFSGFEKLREVMQTGIEVQAVFVRLQASLEANGIAANNLQTELGKISANTATPLEQVTEAAAELAGSFNNIGNKAERLSNIQFATNIASQLANISQGALTAQEAAQGLRDVIFAYGDSWAKSGITVKQGIKQTGDQIAHLSQLTGVGIKDITQGTTQIAMEANEFGLNQRQASTLAAYISAGTNEPGEEAAAQASRMLATLYNGKTQNILERTYLYGKNGQVQRDQNGNPVTLATPQQFEQGKIGDVLTNIAANWDKLNARQRQAISSMMGTGIQARAFAAFVGGGQNAANEMNGTGTDNNSLKNQNNQYLNTVAGQIKQLDEDFQNLGSTLQRLGAFDAIGLLAKSLDELFKTINKYVGGFASLMSKNPLTSGLMKWSILILEAAAAWKLFGSAITTGMLKMRMISGVTPINQAEIAAATAAGTRAPRPVYAFGSVAGAMKTNIGSAVAGRASRFGSFTRDVVVGRNFADATPAGLRARAELAAAQAAQSEALAVGTKAQADANAAMEKKVAAQTAEQEASEALAAAERQAGTTEEELTVLRRAQIKASEALLAATEESAKAQQALAEASAAATVATEEVTIAEDRQVAVRSAGFLRGFSGGMGGRMGMMLPMAALMLASPTGDAISGGESPGDGMRGFLGNTAKDAMYGAGIGGMIGGPLGAAAGGIIGTAWGAGQSVLDAYHKYENAPSMASNQASIDFVNLLYNNPDEKLAVKGAQKRLGYKAPKFQGEVLGLDQLDKIYSVDDLKKFEDTEKAFIKKHADEIAKAGGNNSEGQKAIKHYLDQVKGNLQKDFDRRLAELEGLNQIDQLTANQVQALGQVAGQVASYSPETLANQSGAIATLLQNSGLPTQSQAYKNLVAATNMGGPVNTLGINDKGQIGQYSADGRWHAASKQQMAGIGPTEGSHLAQLGGGPRSGGLTEGRLTALRSAYQQVINNAKAKLDNPADLNSQDLQTEMQNLTTGLTGYQMVTQQLYQAPITQEQGQANMLASLGGTPQIARSLGLGGGGNAAAVAQLQAANSDIKRYNDTLDKTDPQYWSNLQQIQQNKMQIAQLQASPEINRLLLQAAQATDATQQANIKYQQAVDQLNLDKKAGASSQVIGQDRANIAGTQVGQRQAAESVAEAQAAANTAGIRNDIAKAQADYTEAVRLEGVYAKGGSLADQANELRAVAQATQAQIALHDAIEARTQSVYDAQAAWQRLNGHPLAAAETELAKAEQALKYAIAQFGKGSQQANAASAQVAQAKMDERSIVEQDTLSTYDATAALDKLQGDEVGAAMEAWAKAKQAYAYAVRDYGKNSSQARQAAAQATQAEQAAIQAQLDQVNSFLDLDAALATARGKKGDPEKAARDAVAKVRNQINSYLRHGGKKGTKEYNDLMGQLATAQRQAFDTQLQDQLDTLDFQQQTYKITSSQEIQALQQILKNKQLTLAEQRSITLKIKNLQDSIRQELTQGGLNIPSDIKLPTAYEVRRSIGAGFSGAGTQVNTVNNNQQVTVNNNVPNSQVAKDIANQVISLINQQTSMGLRSSSSTPRNVQTK